MKLLDCIQRLENGTNYLEYDTSIQPYRKSKFEYYTKQLKVIKQEASEEINNLIQNLQKREDFEKLKLIEHNIGKICTKFSKEHKEEILKTLEETKDIIQSISIKTDVQDYKNVSIPNEIRHEILTDFQELDKCYNSGCYKASVILCGRILETALFRLYYEKTRVDLLSTAPNTGLGKLIAKLFDAGVKLEPGLNEQIHLINKARISSVHRKKETFIPSKEQAQAIILYTKDVLNKIFNQENP